MSLELKIKSKHLGQEAKIIHFEEHKLRKQKEYYKSVQQHDLAAKALSKWADLNSHRRWDVRNENRATFLARAFIANKPYKSVESYRKPENEYKFYTYIVPRILAMVNKYGNNGVVLRKDIETWSAL